MGLKTPFDAALAQRPVRPGDAGRKRGDLEVVLDVDRQGVGDRRLRCPRRRQRCADAHPSFSSFAGPSTRKVPTSCCSRERVIELLGF
jgi:hypothetical protein